MRVEELEIDERIRNIIIEEGITELYPPQAEAVKKGLLNNENMVVAIPTASGKTLLAILAILSSLLRNGGKAVYLSPLRALASEKYDELSIYAKAVGLRVAISTGDLEEKSPWVARSDIIIATNEKFDSIIRHQASWLNDIRVVITDEVHLINDAHRGPVLEVVLTQLRTKLKHCQIIALSATINNAGEIASWLDASLVLSDWRPVELKEGVWCQGTVTFASGRTVEMGDAKEEMGYISLTMDMLDKKGQVLVFANTRRSTVASAKNLAKKVKNILSNEEVGELKILSNQVLSIGEKTELRTQLAAVIQHGVAFHHAGLSMGHRKLVENAFRSRKIKALSASPTLSAGINLPARRVIIRNVTRYSQGYNQPIPVLEYKQMCGRAGRPHLDPYGEAIVIAKHYRDKDLYLDNFIRADTEMIYSKLGTEPAMRSHILSFIASQDIVDFDTAVDVMASTFYGHQNEGSLFMVEEEILKVFELLREAKLITAHDPYDVTPFGKRVNELYLDPLSARLIKKGLEESKSSDELALIVYLNLLANTPDLRNYNVRKKEMALLADIYEDHQEDWMNFGLDEKTEYGFDIFFGALKVARVIEMWLSEENENTIFETYNIASGDLHSLLSRFEWLVYSALEISKIFKWKSHISSLSDVNNRIKYGIKEDLLPLVEIPNVGRVRARTLYDAGYTTLELLRDASVGDLSKLSGIGKVLAEKIIKAIGD